MIDSSRVDLGSVQIHKKAISDLASSAVAETEGVSLIPIDPVNKVLGYFMSQGHPGIIISIDKNGQVTIELKVYVHYGFNVHDIARQVQENVRTAVQKTVDISLKDVNVNVHGIERGKQ